MTRARETETGDRSPAEGSADAGGVDYAWVMQVTFVLTISVGAPLVALLSLTTPLPTWDGRVAFAVQVGAVVWLLTGSGAYCYDRFRRT